MQQALKKGIQALSLPQTKTYFHSIKDLSKIKNVYGLNTVACAQPGLYLKSEDFKKFKVDEYIEGLQKLHNQSGKRKVLFRWHTELTTHGVLLWYSIVGQVGYDETTGENFTVFRGTQGINEISLTYGPLNKWGKDYTNITNTADLTHKALEAGIKIATPGAGMLRESLVDDLLDNKKVVCPDSKYQLVLPSIFSQATKARATVFKKGAPESASGHSIGASMAETYSYIIGLVEKIVKRTVRKYGAPQSTDAAIQEEMMKKQNTKLVVYQNELDAVNLFNNKIWSMAKATVIALGLKQRDLNEIDGVYTHSGEIVKLQVNTESPWIFLGQLEAHSVNSYLASIQRILSGDPTKPTTTKAGLAMNTLLFAAGTVALEEILNQLLAHWKLKAAEEGGK
ncbi:hypothetical protein TWF718_009211 [Orbilia javanica]|uniref:Uncharacterized protein n=1 Tax=Orbilia javanica TaxID=47235 RepID=A0AAN8N2J0_9PEZI